uniref:Obg-like GTPase YGR210-like G4 motif-containing domain-containing protein n=1 Tax=Bionectria ochroleuca TaxID=29856 RepID=A0A0B7KC54_BIOOC
MPRDPLIGLVGKPSAGKSSTLNSLTDASSKGKETRGYDPSVDIAWLRSEVVAWILGNLMQKWGSIRRRHMAIKGNAVETLQGQFSGYGATSTVINRTLDRSGVKEPLEDWSDETVAHIVNCFVDEKFPTVIALNKIDHPDADKNISKIAKMQDPKTIVLCSAISEIFLRKMAKQGYIKYVEGSEFVDTKEDLIEQGDPTGGGLKDLDEKNRNRIENLKDMVLYRFGSTGVVQVLSKAAELLGLVPVFPVRNTSTFTSGAAESKFVFRDCVLVKKGSTVGDVAKKVMGDAPIAYVEGIGNMRVSEDDFVAVGKNDILSFKVGRG